MNSMRKLIIDGNAVYEIDEKCMLQKEVKKGLKEQPGNKDISHEKGKRK